MKIAFAALAAVALGVTVVGTAAAPVAAAEPQPVTESPVSADPLPTVQIDGVVWAQVVVGNTVYVGGSFTSARPAGAAPGTQEVPRRNLLAYDLDTGELVDDWSPGANGEVRDLAVSPDGSRLYVSGSFTSVDGTTRYRVASFDTDTGALTTFRPSVNATVHAVDATDDDVFLGGIFTSVNNQSRTRVAAVDAATGSTTRAFDATVADRSVQDLVLSPNGNQVVIAGNFTSVNGSSKPGYGLARLDTATGDQLPLPINNSVIRNAGDNSAILDLASDGEYFYGVGYHWAKKGTTEGTFAASWDDGTLVWLEDCHGDTYSVTPFQDVVYTASHKHDCATSGGFPETKPRTFRHATVTTKTVEGENIADTKHGYPDNPGTPRPEILNWYPTFEIGTYTGQSQGPWSVTSADGYVLYGGEFLEVNGEPQQGLVRFAVRDAAPNALGPKPYAGGADLKAAPEENGDVQLSWTASYDADDHTLDYDVYRETTTGGPIATLTRTGSFWEPGGMTFTDTTAPSGQTTRYAVRAQDPWGNSAWSAWVDADIPMREPEPEPEPEPEAEGTLARDDFSRSVTNGWGNASYGGAWSVSGGPSRFAVDGETGTLTMTGGATVDATLPDVESVDTDVEFTVSVDTLPTGNSYLRVPARVVDGASLGGRIKLSADGQVELHATRDGSPLVGQTLDDLTFGPDTPLHVRVRVTGTEPALVQARVWAAGTEEPTDWQASATDDTTALQAPGGLGINLYTGGSTPSQFSIDDLLVTDPTEEAA